MGRILFGGSGTIKAMLARLNVADWSNTDAVANTTRKHCVYFSFADY